MKDKARTKKDLISELVALRRRLSVPESGAPRAAVGGKKGEEDIVPLIDLISDGVFHLNREGYFTFVNREITHRVGIPAEAFYTLHFFDILDPNDHGPAQENFRRTINGEAPPPFEACYRRPDGRVMVIEITLTAIREEGKIVGVRGLTRYTGGRRAAQRFLTPHEERFRKVVQTGMDAIALFDGEGVCRYVSDAVEDMLGYHPDELIELRWDSFAHPDDASVMATKFSRVLQKAGNIEKAEIRARHRDGSWRWLEVAGSNRLDESEIKAIVITIRDIADRKLAQEALEDSEQRLKELFENMRGCVAIYTVVGDGEVFIFRDFNRAAEKTERIDRQDVIGKSLEQVFPGAREMGFIDVLQRVWKTGTPEQYPATLYRDGRLEGWRENYVYKLASGEIVAIYDDLTEQKRAEMAARESEERFRALFDRSLECMYLYDFKGKFLDANQAVLDLLGYDRDDLPRMNMADILAPDQLPKALQQQKEIMKVGFQKEITEFTVRRKDGSFVEFETKASLVHIDGKPDAILGIARDITERKELVDRLRKAADATVTAMATVVETRDPFTAGHQRRVADLAQAIAREMGLSRRRIAGLRTAANLHDLGKVSVPAEILSKPTRLSDMEFSLVKLHSQSGYDILKTIDFPWPVARMVLEHHERIDGSGYPGGLRGEDVLLESRILAVADVVEAMGSYRAYRPFLGIDAALEEITANRGVTFDPQAVDACVALFREKDYRLPDE